MKNMEKYKEAILNILEKNNDIQSNEDNIRKLLNSDYHNHKITEDEYIELKNFLNQKIKEKSEKEEMKRQLDFNEKLKKFHQKVHLDVRPIYKGEMGIVAPKREIKKGIDDNQKEEK